MDALMGKWTDGWMTDGQLVRRTGRWMDGWIGEWMKNGNREGAEVAVAGRLGLRRPELGPGRSAGRWADMRGEQVLLGQTLL